MSLRLLTSLANVQTPGTRKLLQMKIALKSTTKRVAGKLFTSSKALAANAPNEVTNSPRTRKSGAKLPANLELMSETIFKNSAQDLRELGGNLVSAECPGCNRRFRAVIWAGGLINFEYDYSVHITEECDAYRELVLKRTCTKSGLVFMNSLSLAIPQPKIIDK